MFNVYVNYIVASRAKIGASYFLWEWQVKFEIKVNRSGDFDTHFNVEVSVKSFVKYYILG